MKWLFIAFCVFAGSLFFRPVEVPRWAVDRICSRLSPTNTLVSCGSMTFGFRSGLSVDDVKVLDTDDADFFATIGTAESVQIGLDRRVRIVGLSIPRLHDGYYEAHAPQERNADVTFRFPEIPGFSLVLVRPKILGIAPERVEAEVYVEPGLLDVTDIRLLWPDVDRRMALDGFCYVNLERGCIRGEVRGFALPQHIRPLLTALDLPSAYPYMDGFTKVVEPVPAVCDWNVNLHNCDFRLHLDLKPTLGCYNAVPLAAAASTLDISYGVRGTNACYRVDVGPLDAVDLQNRHFGGTLSVVGTNDTINLLIDAASNLKKDDTLNIIGYLNDGLLDDFACEDPPEVRVKGVFAVGEERQAENDLGGTVKMGRCTLYGVPMTDATLDFRYLGDTIVFTNYTAHGVGGGVFTGGGSVSVPGYDPERASFTSFNESKDSRLEQLAQSLGIDPDDRVGKFDGTFSFAGPVSSNAFLKGLCGHGSIKVHDGHLAQMKLFAGLTRLLAENVPGVSAIVDQNSATCDFTVKDGVLATDNLYIEGGLFSIKVFGTYDIPADELDFVLRIQLLRNDSLLALLVRPVTWPFSKLLLEYRVTGKMAEPQWKYINLLERVR